MFQDNKIDKRHRILRYIAIAFLVTILLACFFVSVLVLPILCTNRQVAFADSSYGSVGTVNDNLFSNPNFNLQGDSLFSFQNKFAQDIVYAEGTTILYAPENEGFIVSTTTTAGANHWIAFLFKPTTVGTYTFTLNSDIVGSRGYLFRLRDTSYYTYVDSKSENFSNYMSISYNIKDLSKNYILQFVMPSANVSASIYWLKIEKGSTFTGYVSDSYSNFGYDQGYESGNSAGYNSGYDKGMIDGFNKYVDNHAISSNLNVDSYISTGGFSFNSLGVNSTDSSTQYDIKTASKVENYTRSSSGGTSTPYDALTVGLNYNLIYTQGTFGIANADGVAGYYGVKSSLVGSNAFNSFINAGTPFSLDLVSARAYGWETVSRNVSLFVAFLDKEGNLIRYNNSYTAPYYLNSVSFADNSNWKDGVLIGDTLNTGDIHYYRLPVDVYGVFIFSEHLKTDYYHAYSMKCNFLPNSDYQSIYDSGFKAGQSEVNTGAYYDNGYNIGYQQGIIKGASEANNYTFLGVIGAAIDAPINSLLSLLDFDLLGFNMRGFFSALLMLSFIILIIRLLLGGK